MISGEELAKPTPDKCKKVLVMIVIMLLVKSDPWTDQHLIERD